MNQNQIEKLPLFPEYEIEETDDDIFTLRSNIHIHKESGDYVKVYLYPITSTYVAKTKTEKTLIIGVHLRECFRMSKYIDMENFPTTIYPLVITLDKRTENFLYRLHFEYT